MVGCQGVPELFTSIATSDDESSVTVFSGKNIIRVQGSTCTSEEISGDASETVEIFIENDDARISITCDESESSVLISGITGDNFDIPNSKCTVRIDEVEDEGDTHSARMIIEITSEDESGVEEIRSRADEIVEDILEDNDYVFETVDVFEIDGGISIEFNMQADEEDKE